MFNEDKTYVKVPEIPFFGLLYGKEGVRPEPERTKEIVALEFPDDKQKLQSFQGMVQYLSPFIPHLSDMMLPLRNLLKSDVFEYNSSHVEAFEKVKRTISSAVMLNHFNPTFKTVVQVDASQTGL